MLSGLAMATAGSSRPCSGGDHEILHAIDHLFPGTASHGELAGAASLFTRSCAATSAGRRDRRLPAPPRAAAHARRPRADARSSSPRRSLHAPRRGPDRYTILEHLDLDEEARRRVRRVRLDAFDR